MSTFYLLPAKHNVKNAEKDVLVDLIRFAGRGISEMDIAGNPGLTRASVTFINAPNENCGIPEAGRRFAHRGRPPVMPD
ncbi:MAG TPA: hypothetical protein VI524_06995 [Anaerolineales bacterium]|nr:hypothetical protein [Anaerolineales bacterium]